MAGSLLDLTSANSTSTCYKHRHGIAIPYSNRLGVHMSHWNASALSPICLRCSWITYIRLHILCLDNGRITTANRSLINKLQYHLFEMDCYGLTRRSDRLLWSCRSNSCTCRVHLYRRNAQIRSGCFGSWTEDYPDMPLSAVLVPISRPHIVLLP